MRYLGIDFGEKRIGLAVSDESGRMAFPAEVISNDDGLSDKLAKVIADRAVTAIVLGESRDFHGDKNSVMVEIESFKKFLEAKFELPVFFELEFLTSAQARHFQGDIAKLDASSAALILQSFLDRQTSSGK